MNNLSKTFGLSNLAVNNRTSVIILAFIILLSGIRAYNSMPKESFPEIVIPTIYVGVAYPGNSPLDIENLITRPIEKEVNTITDVKKITSNSVQDYTSIVVEFGFDVNVAEALLDVKDAVDRAKRELPSDLDNDPSIFELNFSEIPIININLSGNVDHATLKSYAESLEDEIENLSEISKVELRGNQEKEVSINIDKARMEAMGISFMQIEQAIAGENMTISAGDILNNNFRRSIRIDGEFKNVKEIEEVVIKSKKQKVVYLKDIATVEFGYIDRESYASIDRRPVISLDVIKRSGGNLIDVAEKIKAIVKETQENKVPDNVFITITNDTSRFTKSQVENLENSIISGVLLVVLVLLFFLGLRNALFVGVAIPLSMLMGILILNLSGVTLNTMVLFSLILALGMLVDNGIVVVENIYRLMQEGKPPIQAAKEGVGEVALPIISSTLTTLAAFFPLVFWGGLMGKFMQYLPITLIIVLSSSLFVALVINPVLTSMFMRIEENNVQNKKFKRSWIVFAVLSIIAHVFGATLLGNILLLAFAIPALNIFVLTPLSTRFQDSFLPKLENVYQRIVHYALRGKRPYVFFFGMFGLLIASVVFFGLRSPNVVFFPENEPNYINVFIETPTGTDIEKTNLLTQEIEDRIFDALEPYGKVVESVLTNIGAGTSDPNSGEIGGGNATPNKAKITASFIESQHRDGVSTIDIMNAVRAKVGRMPGVAITVDKEPAGPPVGPPINIEITGEEYDELIAIYDRVKQEINEAGIEGIEELKTDLDNGKPELIIHVDRNAASRYGISTSQVAMNIRTALFGKTVSKYKEGEDDYDIVVRYDQANRYDLQALLNQKVFIEDNKSVPISAIATVEYASTFGSVKRKDLDRAITIYSNILDGHNANIIIASLKDLFTSFNLPEGYEINFTGEQEEQAESMAFLSTALLVAVFAIFLIIVAQFNSITAPIIIMFSVIFSTIGVFIGLAVFQMDFVVIMTMIGIISLAGVVVNNAIVLIDYTNLVRNRKRLELDLQEEDRLPDNVLVDSIVEGGTTRLRPVLLTAITTVLGLIPLAIGLNINFFTLMSDLNPQFFLGGDSVQFWGPMSWTIIFGLTFATFLTLVIVPVMYLLFDRLTYKVKSWM